MTDYQPEIGQFAFGQPYHQYDGGYMLDAALMLIRRSLDRILWNRLQEDVESPFDNTGATFDTEGISIHAYSWDDDADQQWNLKCGDVEVSWYKHSWRGVSVNRELTNDDIAKFLAEAVDAIDACDTGMVGCRGGVKVGKPFTYCGEENIDIRGQNLADHLANQVGKQADGDF